MTTINTSHHFRNNGVNVLSSLLYYVNIDDKTGVVTSATVLPNKYIVRTEYALKFTDANDVLNLNDDIYITATPQYAGSYLLETKAVYAWSGITNELYFSPEGVITTFAHGTPPAAFDCEIIVESTKP